MIKCSFDQGFSIKILQEKRWNKENYFALVNRSSDNCLGFDIGVVLFQSS